jgi:hypothetical protein
MHARLPSAGRFVNGATANDWMLANSDVVSPKHNAVKFPSSSFDRPRVLQVVPRQPTKNRLCLGSPNPQGRGAIRSPVDWPRENWLEIRIVSGIVAAPPQIVLVYRGEDEVCVRKSFDIVSKGHLINRDAHEQWDVLVDLTGSCALAYSQSVWFVVFSHSFLVM